MALNNVPLAGQTLLFTRDLIQENFANINTGFAQDHVAFGIANAGKHQAIHLVNQTNAPAAPITGALEVALYAAPSILGAGNPPALFFKGQNSGAGVNGIDFTTYGNAENGWCRLPCGIIMKWGVTTSNGATSVTVPQIVVYPANANTPVFNNVFSVQISPKVTGNPPFAGTQHNTFAQPYDWTSSNLQFQYTASERTSSSARQTTFTYLAIGN